MTPPGPGWDLIVVGAGAAGLLAAARAAERGLRVLLLEKNRKPGVKILMSGGTRCNLTHACDARGIVEAFGPQGRFLHSALARLGPSELVELFAAEGVPTKVEDSGKVFPVSNRALDVQIALLARLRRSGATLALGEPVVEVQRRATGFELLTPVRSAVTDRLLVATGGQSYPGCGTSGDGYRWLADLGHTIVRPRPALVPIVLDTPWTRDLSGVTIPDVLVRVLEPGEPKPRVLAERRASFLFTHFGLSGPAPLDVSRAITGHPRPRSLTIVCDFLPDLSAASLDEALRQAVAQHGKKLLSGLWPEALPRRLVEAFMAVEGIPLDRKAAEANNAEKSRIAASIKRLSLPVGGTLGFEKAEVTAGGVELAEVDSRTMQSKHVPGLYLAGEVLDLDGPIGGYNFQAAFSTGWLAAERM